jgi:uroporphyrinogen-III synthase
MEAEGLQADFVPTEFSGAGLVMELARPLAGKRVLLPRSNMASAELPAGLRAAGSPVTEVVAYMTLGPELVETEPVDGNAGPGQLDQGNENGEAAAKAALRAGTADAAVFFSPSAFHNFVKLLRQIAGAAELQEIGGRVALAAVGPVTAAAIREGGFVVALEAEQATGESLVNALQGFFAGQPARRAVQQPVHGVGHQAGLQAANEAASKLANGPTNGPAQEQGSS